MIQKNTLLYSVTYVDKRRQLHHHHGLTGLWFRSDCHRQDLGVNHGRGSAEEEGEHGKYFIFQ